MSELIDRLPGNESFVASLRSIQRGTSQLKSRQRFSGKSGQLGYTIDSGNEWDLVVSIPYSSINFLNATFLIEVEGDGSQEFPIMIPSLDTRINGTGDASRMRFNAGNHGYDYNEYNLSVSGVDYCVPAEEFFGDPLKNCWRLRIMYFGIYNDGTMTLRLKFRAQGSCPGTIRITRES